MRAAWVCDNFALDISGARPPRKRNEPRNFWASFCYSRVRPRILCFGRHPRVWPCDCSPPPPHRKYRVPRRPRWMFRARVVCVECVDFCWSYQLIVWLQFTLIWFLDIKNHPPNSCCPISNLHQTKPLKLNTLYPFRSPTIHPHSPSNVPHRLPDN